MKLFMHAAAGAIAVSFGLATVAGAVPVRTDFTGEVFLDNGGDNPFGLAIGDAVSGYAIWDTDGVTGIGSDEEVSLEPNGWDFSLTLGSFTFGQSDVNDPSYSSFFFNAGAFDGLVFYYEGVDIDGFFNLLIEDFDGGMSLFAEDWDTGDPTYLGLDWDFASAVTTPIEPTNPIPLPATLPLLLAGLAGTAALGARRRTRR